MDGIVVGVGSSAASRAAVLWAVREAVARGVAVTAVRSWLPPAALGYPVAPLMLGVTVAQRTAALHLATEQLGVACAEVPGADRVVARPEAVLGRGAQVLVDAGRGADLLVVGRPSGGAGARGVLGPVTASVLQHARCPVVVVPEPVAASSAPARVLVGVDHSFNSLAALRLAVTQAARRGVSLVPVMVREAADDELVDDVAELEAIACGALQGAASAAGADGVAVEPVVERGHPAAVLHALASPQDLLVLGAGGRAVVAPLLGSTSAAVVRQAACPVLVVPRGCAARTGVASAARPAGAGAVG